jgi:hypothetical protein
MADTIGMNARRRTLTAAVALATVLALAAAVGLLAPSEPEWFGVVYPNVNNRNNARVIGMYKTLAECREALQQEFYEIRLGGAGGPRMAMECHSECEQAANGETACKRVEPGIL